MALVRSCAHLPIPACRYCCRYCTACQKKCTFGPEEERSPSIQPPSFNEAARLFGEPVPLLVDSAWSRASQPGLAYIFDTWEE